ncbi:MAG: 2-oxoglutarate dehydrogenase E1 component, partial [Opitutales bacterium]
YYERWLQDGEDFDPQWHAFFEGFELALTEPRKRSGNGGATTVKTSQDKGSVADFTTKDLPEDLSQAAPIVQSRVTGAIYAYRSIGHTQAHFNPLRKSVPQNPRLSLERLGLADVDLDIAYHTGNYLGGTFLPIREILDRLKATYCGHIGCEYLFIQETPKRRWLQARMEPANNTPDFTSQQKVRILDQVMAAETFERFLHTRFVGQKRFSLEGGEAAIAALDSLIEHCPEAGVEEVVMGMAHRGRLNVLANILGKSLEYIFAEFSENYIPQTKYGDGDVKYHLGYETTHKTSGGQEIELVLAANPSHLEAVDPVVNGKARARQRIRGDFERKRVLPLLLHGDAAFAAQGVVAETLNLSRLKGYTTGGTIHLIVNNQIGFTTDPRDARSTRYCTDIAKMIEVPVFHVNGEDPLAVCHVMKLALDYRQQFGDDVIIDMYCYRKHGHNESDEPGFTQPDLYKRLKKRPPVSEALSQRLVAEGVLTQEQAEGLIDDDQKRLDEAFLAVQNTKQQEPEPDAFQKRFDGSAGSIQSPYNFAEITTGTPKATLDKVADALTILPENFAANRKIARQRQTMRENYLAGENIDWAFAEQLAFGTLMLEGTPVRLSGQDSERGTFSQRHSVLYDEETRTRYVPLLNIEEGQAIFCVHNSSLSEAAVLGFDFGYSLDFPEMLAMWEAQFGDFANGAQVHFDQFIASSESKWGRISGLVMLLPHGYEGQGPEHSSARLERYLQACAEDNIQVANLTTPAQYFHILRRQMKRQFRKPLVIMAPKSLLRHKECVSSVMEFTDGVFNSILEDIDPPKKAKRVIACSGKVYYDLLAYRREHEIKDTAIIRVEQFYPFNFEKIGALLQQYQGFEHFVWCQEEPQNMGAWHFLLPRLYEVYGKMPLYAGRRPAASPAPGSLAMHRLEQDALLKEAFTIGG